MNCWECGKFTKQKNDYCDPCFDKLIEKGEIELEEDKRCLA